jgi:hypothetical protein
MRFRTSQESIDVPWDKAQELKRKLRPLSKAAAEAMEQPSAAGVVWTHEQKQAAYRALREWLLVEHVDDLGPELMDLSAALERDVAR